MRASPGTDESADATPVTVALPVDGDRALVSVMPDPTVDVETLREITMRAVVVDLPSAPLLPAVPRAYAVVGDPEVAALDRAAARDARRHPRADPESARGDRAHRAVGRAIGGTPPGVAGDDRRRDQGCGGRDRGRARGADGRGRGVRGRCRRCDRRRRPVRRCLHLGGPRGPSRRGAPPPGDQLRVAVARACDRSAQGHHAARVRRPHAP